MPKRGQRGTGGQTQKQGVCPLTKNKHINNLTAFRGQGGRLNLLRGLRSIY